MSFADYVIIGIVVLIVVGIVVYLVKAKKNGQKCIGCPYSNACQSNKSCSCLSKNEDKNDEDKQELN